MIDGDLSGHGPELELKPESLTSTGYAPLPRTGRDASSFSAASVAENKQPCFAKDQNRACKIALFYA